MSKVGGRQQPFGSSMPRKTSRLLAAILASAAIVCISEAAIAKPKITTFDAPGSVYGTFPQAIAGGLVTGDYEDSSAIHGFVRTRDGTITGFDPPGSTSTYTTAINATGEIVGYYFSSSGTWGFIRTSDGTITNLAAGDIPRGINDKGYIVGTGSSGSSFLENNKEHIKRFNVGKSARTAANAIDGQNNIAGAYYDQADLPHGFERLSNGNIKTFDVKGAAQTIASSIANGVIAGTYQDASSASHGFVRSASGKITTFDVPKSTSTWAPSIDDSGYIAGYYLDANNIDHGYIRSPKGKLTTIDVPNDADGTIAGGIDSSESITGQWSDSSGLPQGFVRTN